MGKHGDKTDASRRELMGILSETITIASEKYAKIKASNKDRQSWGRLIVSAVDSYNSILKDVELADILDRLSALEKSMGVKH